MTAAPGGPANGLLMQGPRQSRPGRLGGIAPAARPYHTPTPRSNATEVALASHRQTGRGRRSAGGQPAWSVTGPAGTVIRTAPGAAGGGAASFMLS